MAIEMCVITNNGESMCFMVFLKTIVYTSFMSYGTNKSADPPTIVIPHNPHRLTIFGKADTVCNIRMRENNT